MKYKKDLVQIQNPKTKYWILINKELALIVSKKKTPYKDVKIVREVK